MTVGDVTADPVLRARDAVPLLFWAGPGLVGALLTIELASGVLPLAIIATIGVLVGEVAAGGAITVPLAVLAVLLVTQQLLAPLRAAVEYRVTRCVDGELRARVVGVANRFEGVAELEEASTLDRLALAGGNIDRHWHASPGGAAAALVSMAVRYLQTLGAAVLLARFSIGLAVVLTTAVWLVHWRCRRLNRVRLRAARQSLGAGRQSRYTSGLANTPPAAKEVRLFGLLDWLLHRYRAQWDAVVPWRLGVARGANLRMAALLLAMAPVAGVVFLLAGRAGLEGQIDVGSLAIALQAAVLVVALLDPRGDDVYRLEFGLESFSVLRSLEEESAGARRSGLVNVEEMPREAIRFEGVRFAYPHGQRVFDGLDLTVPAGSSLAIVGANGAGKTTLVKLLAGLYKPDDGAIAVDGVPLGDVDLASWRRRLAVIFQDFVRYELSAADNIALRGSEGHVDADALETAATRAGILDVIRGLPRGWETPLARQYTGGEDLSGGQWQRVALARALFAVRAGAGVLVLDEPTANLDVRAESELFEAFLEWTRGLTTILISHRFSTVRHADRICVLEGGRVVEDGSHDQLIAAGGRYAELFELQAARFRG